MEFLRRRLLLLVFHLQCILSLKNLRRITLSEEYPSRPSNPTQLPLDQVMMNDPSFFFYASSMLASFRELSSTE